MRPLAEICAFIFREPKAIKVSRKRIPLTQDMTVIMPLPAPDKGEEPKKAWENNLDSITKRIPPQGF